MDVFRKVETHFLSMAAPLSLPSLPASDVVLEGPPLPGPNSPSSPRRMIFRGRTAGAGELLLEAFTIMPDNGAGTRQNGVRYMRTAPATASKECVM